LETAQVKVKAAKKQQPTKSNKDRKSKLLVDVFGLNESFGIHRGLSVYFF